jgi:hypothetical protein
MHDSTHVAKDGVMIQVRDTIKNSLLFVLYMALALLSACAHSPKDETIDVQGPFQLVLSNEEGRKEKVRYLSRTEARNFEDGQIVHQQDTETAFTVNTEILKIEAGAESDPEQERVVARITTSDKSGLMDLESLALPEPDESLLLTQTRRGTVVQAGRYPRGTVFYIPPVSLPDGPVEVGDTWVLQSEWVGIDTNVPFMLDLVSILKRFVPCGSDECAEIEISGEVRIQGSPNASLAALNFKSLTQGTVLFARKSGTVVWSRIDSLETLAADNVNRRIHSCLESVLVEPNALKPAQAQEPRCDPAAIPSAFVF